MLRSYGHHDISLAPCDKQNEWTPNLVIYEKLMGSGNLTCMDFNVPFKSAFELLCNTHLHV